MRGKISGERERSPMYTMGMMSPAVARYLVHGFTRDSHEEGRPGRAAGLPVRFFAISGHRRRHVTPSVESARVRPDTGSHEEH